jgi:transcriptional regulator with XRE-family HTH domain
MILSAQIRAARALLDWTARETAVRSGVSLATIQRLERQTGIPVSHPRTLVDLQRAFEEAGIEFIGTPEEPGVILRRKV